MVNSFRLALTLLVVTAVASAAPAPAWSPDIQLAIAQEAARLAPPDLYRLVDRHEREFREGILEPFHRRPVAHPVQGAETDGDLHEKILVAVAGAVAAIEEHRPFADIVEQLGRISHYIAQANSPLNGNGIEPERRDYLADYVKYVESVQPRLPLIFYSEGDAIADAEELDRLVARSLARSRGLHPYIGLEYRRIGWASGVGRFDDRSTAFGIASLSFSHAVSDIALTLRYIWLQAGGADTRSYFSEGPQPLLVLPRVDEAR